MTDEALKMRLYDYQHSLDMLANQIKEFESQDQTAHRELLKTLYRTRFLILTDYLRDAELVSRHAGME